VIRSLIIGVACLAVATNAAGSALAQSGVRPYPDPGHRWLGVYAGGPEQYFDYYLRKISLSDSFPNKAAWWADLKAQRAARDDAHRHDVYIVYCGERDGNAEAAKKRLDGWLQAEAECPTYPELIPAICLGEENVGAHREVLDVLARHIRDKYGIPVMQWYSDPLAPDPGLTADGWIWDSYGWDSVRFRKHLMKFVVLGKPAICVPWATDPHWPQWTRYPNAAALIDGQWQQFDICREFNVSCAAFAVAGPHGSVNTWAGSNSPDMLTLRNALRIRREAMHAIRPGELPQTSAGFSARDRAISVGGDPGSPSEYDESFSGFGWLHDANVRGFLHLKLTSRPDEPGFLTLIPQSDGPARASLVVRCESYFPLDSVHVTLDAAAPTTAGARNTLAIAIDDQDESWPREEVQQATDAVSPLELRDEQVVRGKHVFFVRVAMECPGGKPDVSGNRLDRLRVRCVHQIPPPGAAAVLASDANGNLSYQDDFRATRWPHLGRLEVVHPTHGGYRDGGFWVGLKGGTATSAQLVQRVNSPRPLKELAVTANCYADSRNLGGSVTLSVAPRNGPPRWSIRTQGRHDGPLRLDVPPAELAGMQAFDMHVTLSSSSGVEQGAKACATLSALSVQAK